MYYGKQLQFWRLLLSWRTRLCKSGWRASNRVRTTLCGRQSWQTIANRQIVFISSIFCTLMELVGWRFALCSCINFVSSMVIIVRVRVQSQMHPLFLKIIFDEGFEKHFSRIPPKSSLLLMTKTIYCLHLVSGWTNNNRITMQKWILWKLWELLTDLKTAILVLVPARY